MNVPKKPQVTLEDLLRVKRAERPPMEFWSEFDQAMRVKQLAAIVEPRPWWAPFIRVGARVARYQLPVGAVAVLAVTFVTLREYQATGYAPEIVERPAVAVMPPVAAPVSVSVAPASAPVSAMSLPVPAERIAAPSVPASESAAVGRISHVVPLSVVTPAVTEPTPSARYIAANLAAVQADNPNLVNEAFGQIVRVRESREPVRDPLAQIGNSRDVRRSRLLAAALPVADGVSDAAAPVRDRASRGLTEERLYDTISRIGVQGDRVAIRF
jgi:hypothetical protein